MEITYNERSNALHIKTKIYENDQVRALPNRKFSNRLGMWIAPCLRMNMLHIYNTWDLEGQYISPQAKLKILESVNGDKIQKKPFPNNIDFVYPPYEHQEKALDYVYSLPNSALFLEMGLGKSKIAQDKISCHYVEGDIDAVVIVCPCSIRFNWVEELKTHCAVPYTVFTAELKGTKSQKEAVKYIAQKTDKLKVWIVGVESLQLSTSKAVILTREFIKKHRTAVIVDEAHDIKTHNAARSKNLFDMSRNAVYRMVMTGTPISQGVLDLYGLFHFLDPDILGIGDYYSFRNRYAIMEDLQVGQNRVIKKVVGYKNIEELMEIIKPFVFQCTKDEALDLPAKTRLKRYVALTAEQKRVYDELRKESVSILDAESDTRVLIKNALSGFTALQQVCGGFVSRGTGEYGANGEEVRETVQLVDSDKNPKLNELKRIIDELPDDEQVIIWARYRAEVFMITEALNRYRTNKFSIGAVSFLDKTDSERKDINLYMQDKKIRFFVSTPMSGGKGITLNSVRYVVYYSNTFPHRDKVQTEDRNHRIGQHRPVTYIDLVAEKTVDEKILYALQQKKDLADYVTECLKEKEELF